jgi:predicted acetyltransferase
MELVDTSDDVVFAAWHRAVNRGFHGAALEAGLAERLRGAVASRRTTGVYDDSAHDPGSPVGTVNSWPAELTVPGERTIPGWAISSVTVAPTHRRRGIARALLEAELATAAGLGIPIAMLTVSESSIYGRFGFAPAAMAADWKLDTRRARWIGPESASRVDFISVDEWRSLIGPLHESARLRSPGEIPMWQGRWDQLAGVLSADSSYRDRLQAVRATGADGAVHGLALYRVLGGDGDFVSHRAVIDAFVTDDPDAYAALWRFLLSIDLVETVQAELLSVDEPLRWMIADWRGATVTTYEHQYLRILDVSAVFEGRSYASAGSLAFRVDDPYGYAAGTWLLTVTGADAVVERVDEVPSAVPALALPAASLSALVLGGVPVPTLVAAGRAAELTPGAAVAAEAVLHSPVTPWLSRWY